MKKVLATVAAASIVAAGAPAFAADVEVSGEMRVRYQEDNNGGGVKDAMNARTSQRTRVNFKTQVDDQTTAYISLQDTRVWGIDADLNNTAAEKNQGTDLSQAYLQIKGAFGPVDLKVGRQKLVYGKQRMLGGFEWHDSATSWDGFKLTYGSEIVDVDVLKMTAGEGGPNESDESLSGVYATFKTVPTSKIDVYHLFVDGDADADGGALRGTGSWTATGLRVAGKAAGADWDAEYILEGGEFNPNQDLDASLLAISAGYTIAPAINIRVGVDYSVGSGNSTNATDQEAFQTIAATNHPLYGLHDNIMGGGEGNRASNLTATGVNVTIPNVAGIKIRAEAWTFTTTEDVTGPASGLPEDEYGSEVNVQLTYGLTEKVKLHAYHVIFKPGDAIITVVPGAENDEDASTSVIQLHAKF
ncbi:MAG: alginate export family protein [bacterium]|nr:alginate export family protein [bacterium]